ARALRICSIVPPSNSKAEITGKVNLYLAKGAQEVWVVYEDGRITTYSHIGEIEKSALAPDAQKL
ncbi:MAG: Uma2 family endonuclease, partial [Candidatus Electrothrix sp. AR4]|nr:Uma2 family endonuclease [Candidatus Electrothrix sp. AR4]